MLVLAEIVEEDTIDQTTYRKRSMMIWLGLIHQRRAKIRTGNKHGSQKSRGGIEPRRAWVDGFIEELRFLLLRSSSRGIPDRLRVGSGANPPQQNVLVS